ncbi:MAG: T9SS type A sorting domain-containing protein [Bacteroidales bacterium]|nr:T9SS type A sorting domain-containing protein [Bacteroidales bacterium]
MKKILLFSVAIVIGLAVTAQTFQLKNTVPTAKQVTEQAVGIEPVSANASPVTPGPVMVNGDGVDVVSVITIGTAANAYGNGYAGGQKTIVWADPVLGAVTNFHRMGPGTDPPGLSGYLAYDLGINKGMSAGDWTVNNQAYNSVENGGGTYFVDAARYPQAVIYDPMGDGMDEAYCAYFAPNLSNTISTWGGLSWGLSRFSDPSDSTKHLYWYDPPPYTYIPDGMMLLGDGKIIVTDLDQNWESGSLVYEGNITLFTGVWNPTLMDIEYTISSLEHPTLDNQRPANERVGASPNGKHVWIVSLANTGDLPPVGGVQERFYPVMFHSDDYGVTWSDPMPVQLDGTDGIEPIKNYLSDYRIEQLFTPPYPTRDEIPYTTAFDCDIVVDAWGNPHIGVVVGVSADGYSIATGDSAYAVFDIYSPDKGDTWCAVLLGNPWTFRGTFGDLTEDNRVNASVNYAGDKVFFTWLDTQVPGVTDNINPDVFARGFDLVLNAVTCDDNGQDQPSNVTFLSDVTQEAYFSTASYYTFTMGEFDYIPIVAELLSDPNDPAASVTFKYIPDFAYQDGDYTIERPNCPVPFPVGVNNKKADLQISVYPNPVTDIAVMKVDMVQAGNVQISLTNMLGQTVATLDKGYVEAGNQEFTLDASRLNAGVYFATIQINGEKYTRKVVVE